MLLTYRENTFAILLRADILKSIEGEISRLAGVTAQGYISIEILADNRIQELNREYRGIDKVTDVLSFSYMSDLPSGIHDIQNETTPLGDICMSISKINSQALEHGHSAEEEMYRLTVHGFLHILGYDHESDVDYEEMWKIERPVLEYLQREFGILKSEVY